VENKQIPVAANGWVTFEGLCEAILVGLASRLDVAPLPGSFGYFDEDGMRVERSRQRFFTLNSKAGAPWFGSMVVPGRMVIVGCSDNGGDTDCPLTIGEVESMLTWTDRKEVMVPAAS
jgi:hypothetical protein